MSIIICSLFMVVVASSCLKILPRMILSIICDMINMTIEYLYGSLDKAREQENKPTLQADITSINLIKQSEHS
jgi:hypothetical protein